MIATGRNQPDSPALLPGSRLHQRRMERISGTSWSSPAAVALFIETNELHGAKLGWLNSTLYSLFSSTGYNSYYTPCTSGSIGRTRAAEVVQSSRGDRHSKRLGARKRIVALRATQNGGTGLRLRPFSFYATEAPMRLISAACDIGLA